MHAMRAPTNNTWYVMGASIAIPTRPTTTRETADPSRIAVIQTKYVNGIFYGRRFYPGDDGSDIRLRQILQQRMHGDRFNPASSVARVVWYWRRNT